MRSILATAFLAAALAAQSTDITVPGASVTASNTNVPLSAGIGRYQQWYAANELTAALGQPMRFERLQFLAGSGATANATTIDCEVSIGLGYGVRGIFLFGGKPTRPDHEDVASCVFSAPPIGSVGLTEAQARARFGSFNIESFHEMDEDGTAASGPKHWHVFTVIARKM